MDADQPLEALLAYGADPEVLDEYDCIVRKARVYHDVVKIRTDAGARCLKKVFMPKSRLQYVHECTEYIATRRPEGMFVPRMIRTRYGDPFVIHTSGLYYLTAWLAGREADLRKEPELLGTATALARWHCAAKGFADSRSADLASEANVLQRLEHALLQVGRHRTDVLAKPSPSPFERLFASAADELVDRTQEAIAIIKTSGYLDSERAAGEKGLICHGNLARQNVVYDGAAFSLLHYDRAHPGSPMNDLALLLHRCLPAYEWSAETAARCIAAYRATWQDESFDDEVLAALLAAPLRSLQAVLWYYSKVRDWEEEDYVDYLETSLELEEPRDALRDALSRGIDPVPAVIAPERPETASRPLFAPSLAETDIGMPLSARDLPSDEAEGTVIPVQMVDDVDRVQSSGDDGGSKPRVQGQHKALNLADGNPAGEPRTAARTRTKRRTKRTGPFRSSGDAGSGTRLWHNDGRNP